MLTFKVDKVCTATKARAGEITTDHGVIQTPIFMPVGTVGSVKAVHMTELREDIRAQIILGNTYHLYLRPGLDILQQEVDCIASIAGLDPYLLIVVDIRCLAFRIVVKLQKKALHSVRMLMAQSIFLHQSV